MPIFACAIFFTVLSDGTLFFKDMPLEMSMTMQTEVIVPLVGYLLLVFLLSAYAYRKREKGNFLTSIFLVTALWVDLSLQ